jgi:hypothetical protein
MDGGGVVGGGGGGAAGGVRINGADTVIEEVETPKVAAADVASAVAFGAIVALSSALGCPSVGVITPVTTALKLIVPSAMSPALIPAPDAAAFFTVVKSAVVCTALPMTDAYEIVSDEPLDWRARRREPTVTVHPVKVLHISSVIPSAASEMHVASQLEGRSIDISVVMSTLTADGAEGDVPAPDNAVAMVPTSSGPRDGSESSTKVSTVI